MNVFISWSGERSRVVAEALRAWLHIVIQATNPWISAKDIEKGTRWSSELAKELESTNFGIVCITRDNKNEPWLLFEAGALSKSVKESYVWTYLLDLSPGDVKDPLGQFHHTVATKNDTKELVKTINKVFKDSALPDEVVNKTFETFWPDLEKKLNEAKAIKFEGEPEPTRNERDIMEEILNIVRGVSRQLTSSSYVPEDETSIPFVGINDILKKSPTLKKRLKEVENEAIISFLNEITGIKQKKRTKNK